MKIFKNKTVLVTGASGFIGSNLSNRLLNSGADVYGVSRYDQKNNDLGIKWHIGDLSDYDFVEEIIKKCKPDYIFHLASHVLGARDHKFVKSTFKDNLVTTLNILNVIHEYPCKRLINAGSFEGSIEYGATFPSAPYAAAKMAAANYSKMFVKLYGTPVVTAAIYMVYGPGVRDLTKLVPYTILQCLQGESPKLTGGDRMIDWIFVDDVVSGLLHLATAPNVEGKSIDLGSGKSVSSKEIVGRIIELTNPKIEPMFGAVPDRPFEQERNANVKESFESIGWTAETDLDTGLKKTIEYYSRI